MTPYELRYKIFETALSIAEGEAFMQKEIADGLFVNGVSKETISEYIDAYPEYPTVERITAIAREINRFVSEST